MTVVCGPMLERTVPETKDESDKNVVKCGIALPGLASNLAVASFTLLPLVDFKIKIFEVVWGLSIEVMNRFQWTDTCRSI